MPIARKIPEYYKLQQGCVLNGILARYTALSRGAYHDFYALMAFPLGSMSSATATSGGFQHVHGVLTTRLLRVSGLHGDPSGFLLRSHRDYMKWSDFQYSSDNIRMEFEYQKVIVSFHPLG